MNFNELKWEASPAKDAESKVPEPDIEILFEKKRYTVSMQAYYTNLIGLPDGRVVEASLWLESYPPQHGSLTVVESPDMAKVIQATLIPEKKLKM